MPTLIDGPQRVAETVHFPWAHVEDFRRFFGIDKLLDYSRKRKTSAMMNVARILALRSANPQMQESLWGVAVRTIAIGQALEIYVDISGKLASYRNLDAAIRSDHPHLAMQERAQILAEYLHRNAVITRPDLSATMKTSRLAGLLAHHASDFWIDEHEDLFAFVSRIEHGMQIRFIVSALLAAIPKQPLSDDHADRIIALFSEWRNELFQSINESKTQLSDSVESIMMRANLQQLSERLRTHTD